MNSSITRRDVIKGGAIAAMIVPVTGMLASSGARAQSAALDPNDPTAKALGYVTASATPNQKCSGCAQFQGKADAAQGACTIFAGKTVSGGGWCKSWSKKA
jgi:hypothetical protein